MIFACVELEVPLEHPNGNMMMERSELKVLISICFVEMVIAMDEIS